MISGRAVREILVIGELNVDLVASGLKSGPTLGREILAADFRITLGSASAIFAVGAARLGRGVTFVSRVGNDDFGQFCLDELSRKRILTEHVSIDPRSKTGVTIVLSTSKDRALVTHLGSIEELQYDDVPKGIFDGHRHLHLTSYYLQTSLRPDFPRLMADAKAKGLTTSFDPNSDPEQGRDERIFDVLKDTDILFLNEPEALLLSGTDNVRSAIHELAGSCPTVVIKRGEKGSVGSQAGEFVWMEGFSIDTVDTTGAGDSFATGFVHAFLDGGDLRKCLIVGNACGALSATQTGGTDGQPDTEQLEKFLGKSAKA